MAVYTEVPDDELTRFVADYDIGGVTSFKGIAEGVENSNFLMHTDRGSFILTLYEKRVAPEDLPFFLGLMEHLAVKGFTCPTPVKDRSGTSLKTLAGRPAALISFLEGIWIQAHPALSLPRPGRRPGPPAPGWRRLPGPARQRPLARRLAAPAGQVRRRPRTTRSRPASPRRSMPSSGCSSRIWPRGRCRQGVIHADLFPGQRLLHGRATCRASSTSTSPATTLFAYDLAVCLNAWCFEIGHRSFNVTKARYMLHGLWRQERQTFPRRRSWMPPCPCWRAAAALRFLLTRLYDWLNHPEGALSPPRTPWSTGASCTSTRRSPAPAPTAWIDALNPAGAPSPLSIPGLDPRIHGAAGARPLP